MSYPLTTAAVLTVGIAVAHSYLGERYVLIRLMRREDLPRLFGSDAFTRRTLRFAWHLTSIAWVGMAALMLIVAEDLGTPAPNTAVLTSLDPHGLARSVAQGLGVVFAVSAAVTAAASRGKHLAWPVFGVIAGLCWVAV